MNNEAPLTSAQSAMPDETKLPMLRERYLGKPVEFVEPELRGHIPEMEIQIIEIGSMLDCMMIPTRCRVLHDGEGAITDIRFG